MMTMSLFCARIFAQNICSDFLKVTGMYARLTECSTRVKTYLYETPEQAKPKLILSSEIRYDRTGQWAKNQHLEMLYNGRCVLLIDHLKKQVQYSKPVSLEKIRRQANGVLPDTTLLKAYAVTVSGKAEGEITYHLEARKPGAEFSGIDYRIDLSTYRFREIVYYCDPRKPYQKIRVSYEYFNARPSFAKNQFSEEHIISGKGENAVLTKAYASYKLLNGYNRNLKKILSDE